jgi:hypothetical protein
MQFWKVSELINCNSIIIKLKTTWSKTLLVLYYCTEKIGLPRVFLYIDWKQISSYAFLDSSSFLLKILSIFNIFGLDLIRSFIWSLNKYTNIAKFQKPKHAKHFVI